MAKQELAQRVSRTPSLGRRANTRFAEYVGRTGEAVLGTSLADVAADGSVRRLVGQVKRRGGRVDMKAMSCSVSPQPWQGPTYYDWSLAPLRGRRGPPRGYVVSVIDVTAQTVADGSTRPWSASAPRHLHARLAAHPRRHQRAGVCGHGLRGQHRGPAPCRLLGAGERLERAAGGAERTPGAAGDGARRRSGAATPSGGCRRACRRLPGAGGWAGRPRWPCPWWWRAASPAACCSPTTACRTCSATPKWSSPGAAARRCPAPCRTPGCTRSNGTRARCCTQC